MQVNLNPQRTYTPQSQPSFGMAKLTQAGIKAANATIEGLDTFSNSRYYNKSNILAKTLGGIVKKTPLFEDIIGTDMAEKIGSVFGKKIIEPVPTERFKYDIKRIFKAGTTQSANDNAVFAKKQLTTWTGKRAIKNFFKQDEIEAQQVIQENIQKAAQENAQQAAQKNIQQTTQKNSKQATQEDFQQAAQVLTPKGVYLVQQLLNFTDKNMANPKLPAKKSIEILNLIKEYLAPETVQARMGIYKEKMLAKK